MKHRGQEVRLRAQLPYHVFFCSRGRCS